MDKQNSDRRLSTVPFNEPNALAARLAAIYPSLNDWDGSQYTHPIATTTATPAAIRKRIVFSRIVRL